MEQGTCFPGHQDIAVGRDRYLNLALAPTPTLPNSNAIPLQGYKGLTDMFVLLSWGECSLTEGL